MATIAQLIGGAGTGKTSRLMQTMSAVIERGIDPLSLGFVSFTRAARREAAYRASQLFQTTPDRLEQDGWFRTLHSVCYKCLGVGGELLTDNRESRRWLENALQLPVAGVHEDDLESPFEKSTPADLAIGLWDAARARMEAVRTLWDRIGSFNDEMPDIGEIERIVTQYEQAKRLDGRVDFTDIIGRFGGVRFTIDGPEDCRPDGWCPEIPVWFFDEQQDASALLDRVCHRLIQHAEWVYVAGDPFQAIYGFAGADPKFFMNWPAKKREVMSKSYRCPRDILHLSESILKDCTDYWDRGIAPADHDGHVFSMDFRENLVRDMDLEETWLLIARTNFQAVRFTSVLNKHGIPWSPTKGNGTWGSSHANSAIEAMLELESGEPIDGNQWRHVLKAIPSKYSNEDLLERGTKKKFEDGKYRAGDLHPFVRVGELEQLGATARLKEMILDHSWRSLIDKANSYCDAIQRWGHDAVKNPRVRVGTIHSVKGAEADNVMLSTAISLPIVRGRSTDRGNDEELRTWYVGATRARKHLYLLNDRRARYSMRLPI